MVSSSQILFVEADYVIRVCSHKGEGFRHLDEGTGKKKIQFHKDMIRLEDNPFLVEREC